MAVSQIVSDPIAIPGRDLVIAADVTLTTTTAAFSVDADRLTLETGARIAGVGTNGSGTNLEVTTAGVVWVKGGAAIITAADKAGGTIAISAGGDIEIDGQLDARAGRSGFGGSITLDSAAGDVLLTAPAPAIGNAGGDGTGGDLAVSAPAGDVVVDGTLDFSGGDGGSIDLYAAGTLTTTAGAGQLDVSAITPASDAGSITLHGTTALSVGGPLIGPSSGSNADGAGTGADVSLSSNGDVTIGGQLDLTGPGPDGQGGSLFVRGAAVTITGALRAAGKGEEGCGGDAVFRAAGPLALGPMDVSGGSCGGGTVDAASEGDLSASYEINGDGSKSGQGATIRLGALRVLVMSVIHANGIDGGGAGGVVALHGCALTVGASAQVQTLGASGMNLLRSNGTIVVKGPVIAGGKTCTAGPDQDQPCASDARCTPPTPPATIPAAGLCAETGSNVIEYANPATIPVLIVSPTPVTRPRLADLGPCVEPQAPPTTTSSTTSTSTTTSTASSTTTASSTSSSSTSSVETSTSSSSTASSSTTSTASSTSSSRSSSSTTSSSSSTTTMSTLCSALACVDGDPCTDDVCADGACANRRVGGEREVTCRLGIIETDLRAAVPAAIGGSRMRGELLARVDASRRAIETAGDLGTPRARRSFRRAGRHLQALIRGLRRGTRKGAIEPRLGDRILSTAESARSWLLPLQKP